MGKQLKTHGEARQGRSKLIEYHLAVPRDRIENVRFRQRMWKEGLRSKEKASFIRHCCTVDPLFFVNTFCWTYQPTWCPDCPVQPFITFPFQEQGLKKFAESTGRFDLALVKSRGIGASWIAMYEVLRRWLFFRMQSLLLVSRKEKLVWNPGDLDALFSKIEFALNHLPTWMRPPFDLYEMRLVNKRNRSVVNGTATTGDIARGGRRTLIVLDEFAAFDPPSTSYEALAATQSATNSRWFISTPQGVGNAFYDIVHKVGGSDIETLDWGWEHVPFMRRGLYRTENGKLKILDESYDFPPDYQFILDGRLRSPWYDNERKRMPLASLAAQELDRDFLGSGSPFFRPEELRAVESTYIRPPDKVGFIDDEGLFVEEHDSTVAGKLRLWFAPLGGKSPRDRKYAIGVDISAGTGASNSCLSVVDLTTGEKVAEWASPNISSYEFADLVYKVGHWFSDFQQIPAYVIHDALGPGREFGKRLEELGYGNLHFQFEDGTSGLTRKKIPGFWSTPPAKRVLLGEFGQAMLRGQFIQRSEEALKECREYRYTGSGNIEHVRAASSQDPSGARENHGDRVIADALACRAIKELARADDEPAEQLEPVNCMAARLREYEKELQNTADLTEGWLL